MEFRNAGESRLKLSCSESFGVLCGFLDSEIELVSIEPNFCRVRNRGLRRSHGYRSLQKDKSGTVFTCEVKVFISATD